MMQAQDCTIRVDPDLYVSFQEAVSEARLTSGVAAGYLVLAAVEQDGLLDQLADADGLLPPAWSAGHQRAWRPQRRAGQHAVMIPRVLAPVATDREWAAFEAEAARAGLRRSPALAVLVHATGRGELTVGVQVRAGRRTLISVH